MERLSENNPYLLVAIDDLNAKHRHWYSQDTDNSEGTSVQNVGSPFGLNLDYNNNKGHYTCFWKLILIHWLSLYILT